jgi:multiple sugar transport system ATP-binding protein
MTLGSRIVVLNYGVIQQIGTPAEIYERPANMFVADFMGSPPMNLVPATYANGDVTFNGQRGAVPASRPGLTEGPVVVGIRPEAFTPAAGKGALSISATSVENAGSDTYVEFDLGGKIVTARLPGKTKVTPGQTLALDIDLGSLSYFDPKTELRIA